MSSCSSDNDDASTETNIILPKTIAFSYPDFPRDNYKSAVTYDGNKIVSIVQESSKSMFFYTGNVISRQETFDIDAVGKETKDKVILYTYENGKLKTRVLAEDFTSAFPSGQNIYTTIYTHNTDDVVSYIQYYVDATTQVEKERFRGKMTYKDGNLIKKETGISVNYTESRLYEYDSKSNAFKNVLGLDLLLDEIDMFASNNCVKVTRIDASVPANVVYLTTYIYNENGYPTKRTSLTSMGTVEQVVEFTYE